MKTKLTVTIEEELIPKAKQRAKADGVSLSQLIERALQRLTSGDAPSFSARWHGKFRPAKRNDERYKTLARKYL